VVTMTSEHALTAAVVADVSAQSSHVTHYVTCWPMTSLPYPGTSTSCSRMKPAGRTVRDCGVFSLVPAACPECSIHPYVHPSIPVAIHQYTQSSISYLRIHFKIAILTYRTLQSGSPSYHSSLINLNAPSRLLRSSSHNLLHVPFTTTAIGCKAFSFGAPTVWNSIPLSIRQSP